VAGRLGESPRHERGNDVGTNGSSYDSTSHDATDNACIHWLNGSSVRMGVGRRVIKAMNGPAVGSATAE